MAAPSRTARLVASRLRAEIEARHLTQSQLANLCGLSQGRISEILRPRFDPRLGTVEALANGLGLPVADLLRPADSTPQLQAG